MTHKPTLSTIFIISMFMLLLLKDLLAKFIIT
jgi:hypothetical protein